MFVLHESASLALTCRWCGELFTSSISTGAVEARPRFRRGRIPLRAMKNLHQWHIQMEKIVNLSFTHLIRVRLEVEIGTFRTLGIARSFGFGFFGLEQSKKDRASRTFLRPNRNCPSRSETLRSKIACNRFQRFRISAEREKRTWLLRWEFETCRWPFETFVLWKHCRLLVSIVIQSGECVGLVHSCHCNSYYHWQNVSMVGSSIALNNPDDLPYLLSQLLMMSASSVNRSHTHTPHLPLHILANQRKEGKREIQYRNAHWHWHSALYNLNTKYMTNQVFVLYVEASILLINLFKLYNLRNS